MIMCTALPEENRMEMFGIKKIRNPDHRIIVPVLRIRDTGAIRSTRRQHDSAEHRLLVTHLSDECILFCHYADRQLYDGSFVH